MSEAQSAYDRGEYSTALRLWLTGAQQGETRAQVNLGWMYARGQGVPRDLVEAIRWFRLAADSGDASAQTTLGVMYAGGRGLPRDDVEAVKWFRLAAAQGRAVARAALAEMHAEGRGARPEDIRSLREYRVGATEGPVEAQASVGGMESRWQGSPDDPARMAISSPVATPRGRVDPASNRNVEPEQRPPVSLRYAAGEAGDAQIVCLPHDILHSSAWRSLSGAAVKVWLELRSRYAGGNNGRLTLSLDEAARLLRLGKATVKRALDELRDAGFVVLTSRGQWQGRVPSKWAVTDIGVDGAQPTRAWLDRTPRAPRRSVPKRPEATGIVPK